MSFYVSASPLYRAQPIELPATESVYEGDRVGVLNGGSLFIGNGARSLYRSSDGIWHVPPVDLDIRFANVSGLVVGYDADGEASIWDSSDEGSEVVRVGGEGEHYDVHGVSSEGAVLLQHYKTAENYIWREGVLQSLADMNLGFSLENRYVIRMASDGGLWGVEANGSVYQLFSFKDDRFEIYEEVSLTASQVEDIEWISDTGYLVTRDASWESSLLMGPNLSSGVELSGFFGYCVNSQGMVVGLSLGDSASSLSYRASVWMEDGGIADLNDQVLGPLDATLIAALSVNDSGDIVALGDENGSYRAYLLQAIASEERVETSFFRREMKLWVQGVPLFEHDGVELWRSEDLVAWEPVSASEIEVSNSIYRHRISDEETCSFFYFVASPSGE